MLNEAVETHFKLVRGLSFGADYLTVMNPDYVTTLVKVIRNEISLSGIFEVFTNHNCTLYCDFYSF